VHGRTIRGAPPASHTFEHAKTLLTLGGVQRRAKQKLAAANERSSKRLELFERNGRPPVGGEDTRRARPDRWEDRSAQGALTATEQSIAQLVAAGHSNADVAHELFISPKTVEWNLSKIYKKLHVRSRTELAAKLAKQAASRQP
jgi:DNA-binding NarL/FixJ family response regulator